MQSVRLIGGAVIIAALASGCGSTEDTGAGGAPPAAADARQPDTTRIPEVCLDETTISGLVGFTVKVEPSTLKSNAQAVNCTFPATDQTNHAGLNVAILVAPASFAQQAIDDITASADRAGTGTQAVDLGQGGLSYGSSQRSAAATVIGGKLIGVTIDSMGLSKLGDKRDAAVAVLRQVAAKL